LSSPSLPGSKNSCARWANQGGTHDSAGERSAAEPRPNHASLKLFCDEMRVELRRFNRRVPDFGTNCAKKHGFFAAN